MSGEPVLNLEESESAVADTNLTATLNAFRHRIQNRKAEQATEEERRARAAKTRQRILLEAMTKVRRSLAEVSRIDLGERYHLSLHADDWHGWPRIFVTLVDSHNPKMELPRLTVVSHDRHESASIEISAAMLPVECLSLVQENEVKQLPFMLKRCVRAFLDQVGEIVLSTSGEENETAPIATDRKDLLEETPPPPPLTSDDENFLDNTFAERDIFDKLPVLDGVRVLPSAE